jgi:hypothetical protein
MDRDSLDGMPHRRQALPRVRHALFVFATIGCAPSRSPAPPSPTLASIDAALPDAASAPPGEAASTDAPPADAAMAEAPRCPAGQDRADPAAVLPARFTVPAAGKVCDLDDRIILVDERTVTVLTRPRLTRARAPIQRTDKLDNRCDGPGGGHAGCSITFRRVHSAVLGKLTLEFGNNVGDVLYDERQENSYRPCREVRQDVIATCSTATRFVTIEYREVPPSKPTCWQLRGAVWEGSQPTQLDVELDRAASDADHWVVHLPARAMTLRFDRRGAVLEVGAQREPCVAFRLARE